MHVCNSHLESPIDQVVVPTGLKTTAAEIVAEALIKFDLVVSANCHLTIVRSFYFGKAFGNAYMQWRVQWGALGA